MAAAGRDALRWHARVLPRYSGGAAAFVAGGASGDRFPRRWRLHRGPTVSDRSGRRDGALPGKAGQSRVGIGDRRRGLAELPRPSASAPTAAGECACSGPGGCGAAGGVGGCPAGGRTQPRPILGRMPAGREQCSCLGRARCAHRRRGPCGAERTGSEHDRPLCLPHGRSSPVPSAGPQPATSDTPQRGSVRSEALVFRGLA